MILPVGSTPLFPSFMSHFGSYAGTWPDYRMEWTVGNRPVEGNLRNLDQQLSKFDRIEACATTITCTIPVGVHNVELTFRWEEGARKCTSFSINWFLGDIRALDSFSREVIGDSFYPGSKIEVAPEFRRAREKEVRSILGFLNVRRVRPRVYQMASYSSDGEAIWREFIEWNEGPGKHIGMTIDLGISDTLARNGSEECFHDVWRLVVDTGGTSACVQFNLEAMPPESGEFFDKEFHEWLEGFVGCRTLSGRAAMFGLGAVGHRPKKGYLSAYLAPEGAVIGYFSEFGGRSNLPPDVGALLSGAEWVRGSLPDECGASHPIYRGGESEEPLVGGDLNSQIKLLHRELKRWTPPPRVAPAPGSLEEQLDELAALGVRPDAIRDVEDFLEAHSREWYEGTPYLNVLCQLGDRFGGTRWSSAWNVDLEKPEPDHDLGSLNLMVRNLNSLTRVSLKIEKLKVTPNATVAGSFKIEFTMGWDRFEWDLDGMEGWFSPDLVVAFNTLLEERNTGYQIYCIKRTSTEFLLLGLNVEEVSQLNKLLPVPLTVFSA